MLFLGGAENSVNVTSNSEMMRAGVLFKNFGYYRELILILRKVGFIGLYLTTLKPH